MTDADEAVCEIDFARDFSRFLGPRYERYGKFSGEAFLRDVLRPAWMKGGLVEVDLDSFETSGPSFFDEAFAGLVSEFGLENIRARLKFRTSRRQYLVERIWRWMEEAEARRSHS